MRSTLLFFTLGTLALLAFHSNLHADSADIPTLEFYLDDEKVHSRPMTASEHKHWASLQLATQEMKEISKHIGLASGKLAEQGADIASVATSIAAKALTGGSKEEIEDLERALEEMTSAIEMEAVVVEEQGEDMEEVAELIESAASDFEREVKRNAKDIEYDNIMVTDADGTTQLVGDKYAWWD